MSQRKPLPELTPEKFEALARYSRLQLEAMTVPKLREISLGLIRSANLLTKEQLIDEIWEKCAEKRAELGILTPVMLPEIITTQVELQSQTLQENLIVSVASSIERLYAMAAQTGSYKQESEANRAALGLLAVLKTYEKNLAATAEPEEFTIDELRQEVAGQTKEEVLEAYLARLNAG